jgi:hypothetical protein
VCHKYRQIETHKVLSLDQQKKRYFSRSICLFALLVHAHTFTCVRASERQRGRGKKSTCVCAQAGKQQIITHKLKELFDQVYQLSLPFLTLFLFRSFDACIECCVFSINRFFSPSTQKLIASCSFATKHVENAAVRNYK